MTELEGLEMVIHILSISLALNIIMALEIFVFRR